jgi:hypothetical protein
MMKMTKVSIPRNPRGLTNLAGMVEIVTKQVLQMPYQSLDHTYYHDMDIHLSSCLLGANTSKDTRDASKPYYKL